MVSINNRKRGRALRIAVGTLLIYLLCAGGGASALSNDGGGSWASNRDITISNTGGVLEDYQILVNLTGAAFPTGANTSGEDVRFTNSAGMELAFWIEEWNSSAQKAKVWVNVTSIPVGTSRIRMWWGNPNATSSSNGNATFVFFDGFEGINLDANKWTWNSGSTGIYDISNGLLRVSKDLGYPGEWVYLKSRNLPPITDTLGYQISTRVIMPGSQDVNVDYLDISNSSSSLRYAYSSCRSGWCSVHEKFLDYGDPTGSVSYVGPNPWSKTWILNMAIIDSNGNIFLKQENGLESYSSNDAISFNDFKNNVVIYLRLRESAGHADWDYVRVRKFASPEPTVLSGPVAEYHFDGDANDSSGNGNNGTILGGAAFVDGVSGQAMSFDGVNDYVDAGNGTSLNITDTITIVATVYSNTGHTSNFQSIIAKRDDALTPQYAYGINFHTSPENFQVYTTNGVRMFAYNLPVKQWTHVVGVLSSDSVKLYINGNLFGTAAGVTLASNTAHFKIAKSSDTGISSEYFDGLIDEVRIYDRALSADEIRQNYAQYALSNPGGGTWQYTKDLTILNPGAALTDYQMLVNLTGTSFPIEANISGADVRFTDAGGAELNYWIEEWNYSSQKAKVWVNVSSIPARTSALRLWWGNPSAGSSSNGDATFEFFDDFEGTSLNLAKWDVNAGANYTISNGAINIAGNSWGFDASDFGVPAIYSKVGFNDYSINARVTHDTENSVGDINYWLIDTTHYYAIQHDLRSDPTSNEFVYKNGVSEGWLVGGYQYKWYVNEWIHYSIKVHSDVADFERISEMDSNRKITANNIGNPKSFSTTNRKIGLSGDAIEGNFTIDFIFVRKYTSTDPSVSSTNYNLSGHVLNASSGLGIPGALVKLDTYPQYNATTNSTGDYSMTVPSGTFIVSASAYDYSTNTTTVTINGDTVNDFALSMLPPIRFINGTVIDSLNRTGIAGAKVFANNSLTTTNASGFYSFAVASGSYNITVTFEPAYYTNSSISVSTIGYAVAWQDIELRKKPTGNITGSVTS